MGNRSGPETTRQALDEAEHGFQHALQGAPLVERFLLLGGRQVRLRFAGEAAAASLFPALAHLHSSATPKTDLTISIWEDASFVPREWWPPEALQPGNRRLAKWDACTALDQPYFGEQWLVEAEQGRAYVCFGEPAALRQWQQARPLRGVLNAWFQHRGSHIVHAAAVADDHHAVLLAGGSGAGKSTTALHCLLDPLLYFLGDDLCLVDIVTPAPMVHSVYCTAKAMPGEAQRLPALAFRPDVQRYQSEKQVVFLDAGCRAIARSRLLQAILLPRLGSSSARIVPASSGDAFRALAPNTLNVVVSDFSATWGRLAQLVRRLPIYWLDLGPERRQVPTVIAQFLASMRGRAAA